MYIYCITNKINNKKYIGSTNNPNRRKKEHFNAAYWQSARSYNYPLQKAIRKYGEESFFFEILEECEEKIVAEREKEWIIKFNSLTNIGYGYNQTVETDCALRDKNIINKNIERNGIKCALVDNKNNILQTFKSYTEACRIILGINEASLIRRVCNGEVFSIKGFIFRRISSDGLVEIPINQTRQRRTAVIGISVNNPEDKIYYESVSEAARQEKIERASISKCINGSSKYSKVDGRIWRKVGNK